MLTRWWLAAFHLLALGIGLGAVWARARSLRGPLDGLGLRRVFTADAGWGLAFMVWMITGVWRLLASSEKATQYYLQNHVFWLKMGALGLVLLLEISPMVTLIRWRRQVARGQPPETGAAAAMARISEVQAALVVLMVFAATAMARGLGARP